MKQSISAAATAVALLLSPLLHAADQGLLIRSQDPTPNATKGATLDVPRHVIATGGGRSAGGAWVIRGTVGQADAEPLQPSTDGADFYAITGGFWPALPAPRSDWLFADGFEAQAD